MNHKAKEVLESNGFDFDVFELENEHSAKNLLSAMREYARFCCEQQRILCAENIEIWWEEGCVNEGSIKNAPLPEFLL